MPRKRKAVAHSGPHKYQRIKWNSRSSGEPYFIFKCMLKGCTHYVPKDLVVGNESLCWKCGKEFQMTRASTYLKKPHCPACTKGHEKEGDVSVDKVAANLDKLLGGF